MTVAVTTTLLSQSAVVAVGGIVSCVVLFLLLLICVCGDSGKRSTGEVADTRTSVDGTLYKNNITDTNSVIVNVDPAVIPVENGQVPPESASRKSYRSSGSSPQPGGQRELPAPPILSKNSAHNTPEDEDEDYDHLTTTAKNSAKRASNYDHIKVTPEGKVQVEEHKVTEHFYSEVKSKKTRDETAPEFPSSGAKNISDENEDDYDTLIEGSDGSLLEVKKTTVAKLKSVEDPYSQMKDEESGGSLSDIDPYSSVKDDPYARYKDDLESDSGQSFNPYSKVKDDLYSKVKDDPYSRVKDDPYSRVKDDDPYNSVDGDTDSQIEDPYNKVNESIMEGSASGTSSVIDAYASVQPKSVRSDQITSINVTKNTAMERNGEAFSLLENSSNEYAVVMKSRSDSTPTPNLPSPSNVQSNENDPYNLPPEPPRRYNDYAEPDDSLLTGSQRSSLVQPGSQRTSFIQISSQRTSVIQNGSELSSPEQTPTTDVGASGTTQPSKKREPPYHKITARESLASINQRLARNTYETVAETEADIQADAAAFPITENFYATVEGGSGDGVVTNQGSRLSQNPSFDHYAEIGATGGRSSSVPAPPSLDSLHVMTKSAEGRLPNGSVSPASDHTRNLSDPDNITLDPNYQTVRDCISEMAASSDPNYESVQEVESKRPFHIVKNQNGTRLIRDHFYEEVKPASEADTVKKRVLRSHVYEDVDDVQEQKKNLSQKKQDDVWKRRSDAEK